jgi:hypothetical protein
MLHALLAVFWAAGVWGLAGGALARSSLLELARKGRPGHLGPVPFAVRFAFTLITTPLYPLMGASVFAAGCAGFGLLYWLPLGIGPVLSRALFFIPLVLGLGMAVLLIGMLAIWPLIHASVAAEGEDALDALSRSLSYLNQRTGEFAGYVILAWLIGIPCLIGVDVLVWGVPQLATWGAGLAAPSPVRLPPFWGGVVRLLAHAWVYSYFWTAASILYVLLRFDVDGTSWKAVAPAAGER